jgi:hypothetical protein
VAGPLDELKEDPRELFRELVEWITRPSFGSQSKKEIELKLFELLYRRRLAEGPVSVARIAEELTTTRSRARSLLLEVQTRLAARSDAQPRRERLARFVREWPRLGRVEGEGKRLRMVIDDPFLRDLLRNHAYESGIDIDTSFASEIVTLSWPSYVALLESLGGEQAVEEVVETYAAEVRAALRRSEKRQREFDEAMGEPETRTAKLERAARFAFDYGLPLAHTAAGIVP